MNDHRNAALAVSVLIFFAPAAFAQLTTDTVPRERLVPRAEQVRRDVENARYHLGPIRLQPDLQFHDLGYTNNLYGTTSNPVADYAGTVAAGFHWAVPMGAKMYLLGDAMPEYTWYAHTAERRFLGGTYSASAVALFNRLSLEATASKAKNLALVSSELEVNAMRRVDDVTFDGEFDIFKRLSVFGRVEAQRPQYTNEGAGVGSDFDRLNELNRHDNVSRVGLRYKPLSFFNISVATERTTSEFDVQANRRNNTGRATLVGLHYDRPKAYVNISAGRRKGEPSAGSAFPAYDETTGAYYAQYSLTAPAAIEAFGARRITYGLFVNTPYFLEERNGVGVVIKTGRRVILRAYTERGSNDYAKPISASLDPVHRVDDVMTYGGGMAVRIYRNAAFTVVVAHSTYDSNVNAFDRSLLRVTTGLSLSGDIWR